MRSKITLVLLFLNVALFFFIFHFERSWRTEHVAMDVRLRVLGAEAADIRSLEVVSTVPGGSFSLERRGHDWFLTQPIDWGANPRAVSRIINDLQFLEHVTSFSVADLAKNGQTLADYGLDHPKLTVTFTSGGPDTTGGPPVTTTLRIGSNTQVEQRIYVLSSDGERIHVIERGLADDLSLPVDQLRDDTLLGIPVFEARSLNLQTAAPADLHVRISRGEGGRWSFETPIIARASKEAMDLALNELDSIRVKSFVASGPPLPLPSAAPALRVTIEGRNRHETLFVGQKVSPDVADEYYAQLEGRSALLTVMIPSGPHSLMETLRNAQDELRDRHVLDFDPAAVTVITLSAPNQPQPFTLQQLEPGNAAGGSRWQIVLRGESDQGPQTMPADAAAVQRLLEHLSLLSALRFQSDAPQASDVENWGFNRPELTITLTVPGQRPAFDPQSPVPNVQIVLQLGLPTDRTDHSTYARVADKPYVYAVGPEILQETPVAPAAWRERLLPFLPAGGRIVALQLTDLGTGNKILDWNGGRAGAPEGAPPSPAAQAVLDQLGALRAQSFASDAFAEKVTVAGEERPWKYRLDATIALPGGGGAAPSAVSTLWIADRTGGSEQLAGSREFNAVFVLAQPLVDALWTLTYGARDPGPPPAPPHP